MRYGLLGEKLGHSFSAEIHRRLGRYDYELMELAPSELGPFLTAREFAGLNITIPYKQAVLPYLDEVTPRARRIGAVNTVVNRDGRLLGDNTDYAGLLTVIRELGLALEGADVLIAGSGGTSRTAAAVAEDLGAARVLRLSRCPAGDTVSYESAYETRGENAVLLNTTPCGMFPDLLGIPVELDRLPGLRGVVDAVYNPLTTRLVLEARQRGIPGENGLFMLTAQAVAAAELFTGEPFPPGTAKALSEGLLGEKRNIVLIGMPGCGKSTVGALLAKKLGRPLADTDTVVAERAGRSIPEIFAAGGEAAFRELETQALREIAGRTGQVIATGGGTLLREENRLLLGLNGTLTLLDRPLEELTPTADRPLGDDAPKLRALFAQREGLYRTAAQVTVPVRGTPQETADEVIRRLKP